MKKCPTCQSESPDHMAFCLQCGKPLPDWNPLDKTTDSLIGGPATVADRSVETRYFKGDPSTHIGTHVAPKKSSKRTFVIVAAVLAVVGLGVIVIAGIAGFYFYKRGPVAVSLKGPAENTNTANNSNVAPQPSFTPPTEPTKLGTFTVAANTGWQLSEIDTVPLEEFNTKVTGLIDLAGLKSRVTPKGTNDAASKSRRLVPDLPTGALLMRTRYADGKFSNVQPVTASPSSGQWQNFEDERGRLEFCVNDNAPEQNGGQFVVTVKMTKIGKPKKK